MITRNQLTSQKNHQSKATENIDNIKNNIMKTLCFTGGQVIEIAVTCNGVEPKQTFLALFARFVWVTVARILYPKPE